MIDESEKERGVRQRRQEWEFFDAAAICVIEIKIISIHRLYLTSIHSIADN